MIPTREQLEAWAQCVEAFITDDLAGPRIQRSLDDIAAFLRSDALREALTAKDRAEAWKALVMKLRAGQHVGMEPTTHLVVHGDGGASGWLRRRDALLSQEKEQTKPPTG